MTAYQPIFRSPITLTSPLNSHQGHAAGGMPASEIQPLKLQDLTGMPVILIQGRADDTLRQQFASIPAKPGEVADLEAGLLVRLNPTQLYLFGKTGRANLPSAASLDDRFRQAEAFAHATDYTHGKAVLRLTGPAAAEILSKICGLDFHETVFPNLRAAQSSAAKIKTLIVRCDEGEMLAYFLLVERPLGQYFWETVLDAGQEFGLAAVA